MPSITTRKRHPDADGVIPVADIGTKPGLDLSGANLTFANRRDHTGSILNFEGCNLSDATLRAQQCDIFLGGADLTNATFELEHCNVYIDEVTQSHLDGFNDAHDRSWTNEWRVVAMWPERTVARAIKLWKLKKNYARWEQFSEGREALNILTWLPAGAAAFIALALAIFGVGQ